MKKILLVLVLVGLGLFLWWAKSNSDADRQKMEVVTSETEEVVTPEAEETVPEVEEAQEAPTTEGKEVVTTDDFIFFGGPDGLTIQLVNDDEFFRQVTANPVRGIYLTDTTVEYLEEENGYWQQKVINLAAFAEWLSQ